ncbi:hypothetical protein M3223_17215 [Paenibacillus pasadenensis]|uniref:hypothetical protein n=1 Tax=Paenibacillus pasadenensis TaxID=217090 RepID=UPI0020408C71|nr:hypothetical protein [Paenibacillus pasadenensis]MCM3749099.1 hypothetical protein [Paenibacillus pasadenensis]
MKRMIGLAAAACLLMVTAMIGVLLRPAYAPSLAAESHVLIEANTKSAPPLKSHIDEEETEQAAVKTSTPHFRNVNGISLADGKEDVVTKLGIPESALKDELFEEQTLWSYPEMKIGFIEETIDYISVSPEAGYIKLNGAKLPFSVEGWVETFGEPMFKAEDGVGYVDANGFAAKLFLDRDSGLVISIDFFWANEE